MRLVCEVRCERAQVDVLDAFGVRLSWPLADAHLDSATRAAGRVRTIRHKEDTPGPCPTLAAAVLDEIAYTIRRSDRARKVRVVVEPTGAVEVVLPRRAAQREAAAAVTELRPWIERRLAEAERGARPAGGARGAALPG